MPKVGERQELQFTRAATTAASTKKDGRGRIMIKVILQDEKKQPWQPVTGNLRYEIALENATVGEVSSIIEQALFGDKSQTEGR